MGALCDKAANLVEMKLHGFGVGIGQCERRAGTTRRADCAEQEGILVALVGGLSGTRSASGPLPDLAVLLAYAGFVLEPYLYRRAGGQVGQMRAQRPWEVFL
jgi:hypothetical protein